MEGTLSQHRILRGDSKSEQMQGTCACHSHKITPFLVPWAYGSPSTLGSRKNPTKGWISHVLRLLQSKFRPKWLYLEIRSPTCWHCQLQFFTAIREEKHSNSSYKANDTLTSCEDQIVSLRQNQVWKCLPSNQTAGVQSQNTRTWWQRGLIPASCSLMFTCMPIVRAPLQDKQDCPQKTKVA